MSYTLARIIDTGVGVVFSLVISMLHPSELDKRLGMDLEHTLPLWLRSNQRQPPKDEAN